MEKKQSPPYYAAVVVINYDGEVLLGKRKEDGIWTTPGGSAEPEETDPAKTASRELFEESGVPADPRFLQPIGAIATRNGKFCHTFLYVVNTGVMTTSKLDPDQEVRQWKWFKMDALPNDLKDDPRRFESVRNGYMKFYNVNKSLIESLEKGGKPAQIGEVRVFSGKEYKKMGNGDWVAVVHPEQKKLEAMDAKKEKTPRQTLVDKLDEKKAPPSMAEQHLSDLENGAPVQGDETRSGKPVFTDTTQALAAGYSAEDFREVGNKFYDRAEKLKVGIARMKEAGQKVEPAMEKIRKINEKLGMAFIRQAGHIDDRQAKTKANMKKSTVMLGHADAAEIETANFAIEHNTGMQTEWLDRMYSAMDGYTYGEEPRVIHMDQGDLYLVKVDDGIYSGIFKKVQVVEGGVLEDNAKVRLERMTLPSLVQFCIAKEWIRTVREVEPILTEPNVNLLTTKLEAPMAAPVESDMDKKLRFMDLLNKLIN